MTKKVKVELESTPPSAVSVGEMVQWFQNQQNPSATVLTKTTRGAPLTTPNFDGTCNDLKGCGIVFDSSNLRADHFTHVKHEIIEYI